MDDLDVGIAAVTILKVELTTHRLLESQCRDLLLALALVDHKPDWLIELLAPIRKTLSRLED